MSTDDLPELPATAFLKEDAASDLDFYATPRLVTHIDDRAIAALTAFYRQTLPAGGVILDLMSSWVSHLPAEATYAEVIGHGMNAEELAANPRLTRWFVQNLNRDAVLPLEDNHFDGAMCCVSVQYLQKPIEVFGEVKRVLKPEAPFIVSFSNRCFPTKAVAIWRALDIRRQAGLVSLYLEKAGFTGGDVALLMDGSSSDPLVAGVGWK
jgi:SAM-dependent methyltransferase